jgi:hypothetical protein
MWQSTPYLEQDRKKNANSKMAPTVHLQNISQLHESKCCSLPFVTGLFVPIELTEELQRTAIACSRQNLRYTSNASDYPLPNRKPHKACHKYAEDDNSNKSRKRKPRQVAK